MKSTKTTRLLALFLAAFVTGGACADEAAALAKLTDSVARPPNVQRDAVGEIIGISVNAPDLNDDDMSLFNDFKSLKRLTISHAGYSARGKTGVGFSGVRHLKAHPSLEFFSAGGNIGKEFLAGLAALDNVPEIYIQTTISVDQDWAPIGTMTHLTYLGMRVRNDRKNTKSPTDDVFLHLMPLENLERVLVSEMTFKEPAPFVRFVTTRPKLRELTVRQSNLPETAIAAIRAAMPDLDLKIEKPTVSPLDE